jgi:hypothetical protein
MIVPSQPQELLFISCEIYRGVCVCVCACVCV